MLDPTSLLADGSSTVRPQVSIGSPFAAPLLPTVEPKLSRVVVDTHLHLPAMFELWFADEEGHILEDAGIEIGQVVEIHGGASTSMEATSLIKGEVTSIEAVCNEMFIYSVARGYEKDHRLQRATRSRTFLNVKYSDIAKQVAGECELDTGEITDTKTTHDHVSQVAQTDYDFLRQLAREIGYEVGVDGEKFYFRKASGNTKMGGGAGGLLDQAASAAKSMVGMGPAELVFKKDLLTFLPRISGANVTPEVEVRVWDPRKAKVVVGKGKSETGTADVKDKPAKLADSFGGFKLPIPIPPIPLEALGLPSLGNAPSNNAYVVTNRPLATGSNASAAADEAALGVAEHIASAFAEAEGVAKGNPDIQAGKSVKITGVPVHFEGSWFITQAKHIFDEHQECGYVTRFFVSGRHDRSLLGLTGGGMLSDSSPQMNGFVCGVITNNTDPDSLGRVKVTLPWLAPTFETDWARVVQFGLGKRSGAVFLPEVGDEVLVGFEYGDARRPYVIGGLINENTKIDMTGSAVKKQGMTGAVVQRGFVSSSKNKLLFEDELAPMPAGDTAPPLNSVITLGTKGDELMLKIDQTKGTIDLICAPKPPASQTAFGTVTIKAGGPNSALMIETGPAGKVDIKAGAGGTINVTNGAGGTTNIDGGALLNLKAKAAIKIESAMAVEIKGATIKLN
ncbi:MAG: phage baseplate assembly protein V [Acidimicrobiales bacterium]